MLFSTEANYVRLRLHRRVPVCVRDGTACAGAFETRYRHPQYHREQRPVPGRRQALWPLPIQVQNAGEVPGSGKSVAAVCCMFILLPSVVCLMLC